MLPRAVHYIKSFFSQCVIFQATGHTKQNTAAKLSGKGSSSIQAQYPCPLYVPLGRKTLQMHGFSIQTWETLQGAYLPSESENQNSPRTEFQLLFILHAHIKFLCKMLPRAVNITLHYFFYFNQQLHPKQWIYAYGCIE